MGTTDAAAPLRVLIVDDYPSTCDLLTKLMRMWGFHSHAVTNASQALEIESWYHPDVVLLDYEMPVMNGVELARRLRQRHAGKPLLLVCISGWASERVKQQCLEAGCDIYLRKPANFEALQSVLAAWAASSRAAAAAEESRRMITPAWHASPPGRHIGSPGA